MSHVLRIPLLIAFHSNPTYWGIQLGSSVLQGLLVAGFNYLKLPKERRNDWLTVSCYPFYSWLNASFGTLSFLRVLLISGAAAPYPNSIQARIKRHQLTLPTTSPSPKSPEILTPPSSSPHSSGSHRFFRSPSSMLLQSPPHTVYCDLQRQEEVKESGQAVDATLPHVAHDAV